jgi:hypothetical protein
MSYLKITILHQISWNHIPPKDFLSRVSLHNIYSISQANFSLTNINQYALIPILNNIFIHTSQHYYIDESKII